MAWNGWRDPPIDRKAFQRFLLNQMPFVGGDWDNGDMERHVQQAIRRFIPKILPNLDAWPSFIAHAFDYELFETHRSVFVRCRLPEGGSAKELRFLANRRKLRIEFGDKVKEIDLPSDVDSSRAFARYRDGILEICMPKIRNTDPYREIFIRGESK